MQRANARSKRAMCKCNMRAHTTNVMCECAMHVRQTTLNVSATRTSNAQQSASSITHDCGKRQAHRGARMAKRKCDARARSITRRANAKCKRRMFDAKTQRKSSNGCHVPHVPAHHTVCVSNLTTTKIPRPKTKTDPERINLETKLRNIKQTQRTRAERKAQPLNAIATCKYEVQTRYARAQSTNTTHGRKI